MIKILGHFVLHREIDWRLLVSTGGMPSAHSAVVCGMATSVGMEAGFGSPLFALALIMSSIVMYDAQSVRRAVGIQAKLLNQLMHEFFRDHELSAEKLHELLGHTESEVFAGMALGIVVALAVHGAIHLAA
jgi:acid phosphatase family membrane protein YuiD